MKDFQVFHSTSLCLRCIHKLSSIYAFKHLCLCVQKSSAEMGGKMKHWKKVWGYVPIDFGIPIGTLEDTLEIIRIKNNVRGSAVKIKFSNLYGKAPLFLEQVYVGKILTGSSEIKEIREVTCQGKAQVAVPEGGSLDSDSIPFPLQENEDLAVMVYLKEKQELYSLCQTWSAKGWQSSFFKGNTGGAPAQAGMSTVEAFPFFGYDEHECNGAFGVSGVQVLTGDAVTTVACFGDSITHMSYYFDPLQEILYEKYPGQITLVNCGIGGNRVIYDASFVKDMPGCGRCFGRAGKERFAEDVYEDVSPDIVFLMEGVNDCMHGVDFKLEGQVPTGAMIFEGLRAMIEKAHEKGSRVYVSTVMPFGGGSGKDDEQPQGGKEDKKDKEDKDVREEARLALNELIRSHKDLADGFVDLDEVVRKQEDAHAMKEGLHLGDGLHPNETGGRVIAEAIAKRMIETIAKE